MSGIDFLPLWRLRNPTVCQEQTWNPEKLDGFNSVWIWRPENQGRYWYISYFKGQRRKNKTSHFKHWGRNKEMHFFFYVLIYSGPHLIGWYLIGEVNLLCWVHQFKRQSHLKIPSQTFPDILGIIQALLGNWIDR